MRRVVGALRHPTNGSIALRNVPHPLVKTAQGPVLGFEHSTAASGVKSHVFLGIPYAKPPVGSLRFEKPQPLAPWKVPLKAWNYSMACVPHHDLDTTAPTCEDCLTINILKPAEPPNTVDGYPVAFWVHPSCFNVGSSQWLKYENVIENFVDRGVLVVTFNYRLGMLGFGSTGDDVMPGNMGLFDCAAALKWTYENIGAFGGDAEHITACGLSAGSAAVGQMVLSPYCRPYIKKAVQLSGSYYSLWSTNDTVVKETKRMARTLGIESEDSALIKESLKSKTVKEFNDAMDFIGPANFTANIAKFGPRLDGDFLPRDYHDLLKQTSPVPTFISYSADESYFFAILGFLKSCNGITIDHDDILKFTEAEVERRIKEHLIAEKDFGEYTKKIQDRVIAYYLKRNIPANPDPLFYVKRYCEVMSHVQFFIPMAFEILEKHNHNWPLYLSKVEYFADHHFRDGTPLKGAVHANELHTFFGFPNPKAFQMRPEDIKHRDLYAESLCQFIKNGTPSSNYVPEWPQATHNRPFHHVALHTTPSVRERYSNGDGEAIKFWIGLWQEFGEVAIRSAHYSDSTPRFTVCGAHMAHR